MADKKASAFTSEAGPVAANLIPLIKTGDTINYIATLQNILDIYSALTATLTNKTVAFGSNTVSGTKAEFDIALSDDNFAFVSDIITSRSIIGTGSLNESNNDIRFAGLYSTLNWSLTESRHDIAVNFNFDLKRLAVNIQTYSLSEDSTVTFRDDGTDALTITITGSGKTESAESTVAIASGSLCNFEKDTSASISGSWVVRIMIVEFEPT